MGVQLEFSGGILDNIEKTIILVMEGPIGHLRKLIERWFDRDDSNSSCLDILCQALEAVDEAFLANELRQKGMRLSLIIILRRIYLR